MFNSHFGQKAITSLPQQAPFIQFNSLSMAVKQALQDVKTANKVFLNTDDFKKDMGLICHYPLDSQTIESDFKKCV